MDFFPRSIRSSGINILPLGFEGKIAGNWNWDISQAIGGNTFRFDVSNSNNASQFALKETAPTEFYAGKLLFSQYTTNLNISRDFGPNMGLKSFNFAAGGEFRSDNYSIEVGEEALILTMHLLQEKLVGHRCFPVFNQQMQLMKEELCLAVMLILKLILLKNFF